MKTSDLYPYNGQCLTIGQLSRLPECKCTEPTLRRRIINLEWRPIERAVTEETGITRLQPENEFAVATDKEAWRGLNKERHQALTEIQELCDTARWQ